MLSLSTEASGTLIVAMLSGIPLLSGRRDAGPLAVGAVGASWLYTETHPWRLVILSFGMAMIGMGQFRVKGGARRPIATLSALIAAVSLVALQPRGNLFLLLGVVTVTQLLALERPRGPLPTPAQKIPVEGISPPPPR